MANQYQEKIISLLKDNEKLQNFKNSEKYKHINRFEWNSENKFFPGQTFNSMLHFGDTIQLLKDCKPKNIEEWANYYFQSSERFIHIKKKRGKKNKDKEKNVYYNSGRPAKELYDYATYFRSYVRVKSNISITEEEALMFIILKVIYDPYIGYLREINASKTLQKELDKYGLTVSDNARGIRMSRDVLDHAFATDCFVVEKKTNNPICAIQIKGFSYLSKNVELKRELSRNVKKGFNRLKHKWGLNGFVLATDEAGNVYQPHLKSILEYAEMFLQKELA